MTNQINIIGKFNGQLLTYATHRITEILVDKNDEPIYIFIDSTGGDTDILFKLLDLLKPLKERLITVAVKDCHSCAALLFLHGKQRIITPTCDYMLHTASLLPNCPKLNMTELRNMISYLKFLNKKIKDIVEQFSLPKKTLQLIFTEHKNIVLTPDDCIEFKLATKIAEIEFFIKQTSPD